MSETRIRTTVTPLYPGSLFPEEGDAVPIADASVQTARDAVEDDGRWFALEVATTPQKRWTDGDGGELWTSSGRATRYRIYVGEALTVADIEHLPDAASYSILVSNMRGNEWERVVRTRRGNFQPIEPEDVVIPAQPAGAAR